MLLQLTRTLPHGPQWLYELKLDGYRGVAVKEGSRVHLWQRNQVDLSPVSAHCRCGRCITLRKRRARRRNRLPRPGRQSLL